MFERWFNKREEVPKPVERPPFVPEFVEDPEMETLLGEFNRLVRNRIMLGHEGTPEQLQGVEAKLQEFETGEPGEQLRQYLRPYLENGETFSRRDFEVPMKEHARWFAAKVLKPERRE